MWNLARPDQEMADSVQDIKLRGYNSDAFLTGEFATKLTENAIRPLSVSNIADKYCSTRRDIYFMKGLNRPKRSAKQNTWGQKAGNIVENYIQTVSREGNGRITRTYSGLAKKGARLYNSFNTSHSQKIEKLRNLEEITTGAKEGDTDWLLTLLNNNGRAELGLKVLNLLIKENDSVDLKHIKIKTEIRTEPERIGINSPATPDFIISDFGVVGDIKTGIEFKPFHQLSCAGYALAYENRFGQSDDINWGIIYFFPTRNPSAYVKPLTFAQIYIFPIDDNLRRWFIDSRDEAYNIISKPHAPSFPPEEQRSHCYYCRFKEYCIDQGLELRV